MTTGEEYNYTAPAPYTLPRMTHFQGSIECESEDAMSPFNMNYDGLPEIDIHDSHGYPDEASPSDFETTRRQYSYATPSTKEFVRLAKIEKLTEDAAVEAKKLRDEAAAEQKKPKDEAVPKAEQPRKENAETLAKASKPDAEEKKPIKFKDAVGRKFSFPFELSSTWAVS